MFKVYCFLIWLLLLSSCTSDIRQEKTKSEKAMNVVFILADDLGWSDTELYGTTHLYQTPNIERLSQRGMTFTRAYANSPLCSPTRASILTGQTVMRHGSYGPDHHRAEERLLPYLQPSAPPGKKAIKPYSVSRLDTALPTLGKQIKRAGYHNAHFGKWHLGREPYTPLEHGFDVDVPHTSAPGPVGGYIGKWTFAKGIEKKFPREHIEDRMAEESIQWMRSLPDDEPFFMQYWQFSVHAPFDAKPTYIEKYRRLIDSSSPQQSATYAAMVQSLDDAVGSLLDAVDSLAIADSTIIVFVSDNGGNMFNRIPEDNNVVATSNMPLRGGKSTIWEGGIRVPCIVVWPGVTEPGSRSDEIIQTSDFYPTLLNGLGIQLPENYVIDGIDISPALKGGKLLRESIYTYFPIDSRVPDWLPPSAAVHAGDWKLIRLFHEGENGAHAYRLYNLADDVGERNDLSESMPETVKELDIMLEAHLLDAGGVYPAANPDFDINKYKKRR